MATRNKGMMLDSNKDKSIKVFTDAYISGLWNKESTSEDVSITKLRTLYVLTPLSFRKMIGEIIQCTCLHQATSYYTQS